jgi:hypothetical protein
MGTISILPFENGEYSLLMNRDESPERPAALDLKRGHSDSGLEHAYPVDAKSRGTWIGANARGLSLALMNQHPESREALEAPREPRGFQRSRGEIITGLLGALGAHEAANRLARLDPRPYPPFFLLVLDTRGPFHALRWDGTESEFLTYERGPRLFASSSFQAEDVLLGRQRQFENLLKLVESAPDSDAALLLQRRLHASHSPSAGPFSVCVHRAGARSVSVSEILVRGLSVRLRHHAGPPCEAAAESEAVLG